MEYNASATKHLFWFVETRETARLLGNHSMDEVRQIVIEENLYQQKSDSRLINEFGCIRKRLEALPEELQRMMVTADINTGKLVAFVGCMAADKLLFDLMYDVYRRKIYLGEPTLTDADLNIYFKDKQDQFGKVLTDGFHIPEFKNFQYIKEKVIQKSIDIEDSLGFADHDDFTEEYVEDLNQIFALIKETGDISGIKELLKEAYIIKIKA